LHKYPRELAHDFRRFYGLNSEDIGSKHLSITQAYYYIESLLFYSESHFFVSFNNMDKAMSQTDMLLALTHNRIIDTIPVEKKDVPAKQKAKIELPKKIIKKKIITREQAEKRFAFSRIATE
jgi:hypothetical protein